MNFAVVKFISDDDDQEIVSEVPSSWLTKNNSFCKWPLEKYAAIYIAKAFPPEEDWKEYPVELEGFYGNLIEAKQMAKQGSRTDEFVERGFRKSKPVDYFSPGEEEERESETKEKMKRKRQNLTILPKNDAPESSLAYADIIFNDTDDILDEDTVHLPDIKNSERENSAFLSHEDLAVHPPEIENNKTKSSAPIQGAYSVAITEGNNEGDSTSSNSSGLLMTKECTGEGSTTSNSCSESIIRASVIPDSDLSSVNQKLNRILQCLLDLKVDNTEIKQRLDEISPKGEEKAELPVAMPMKNLSDLETLELYIKSSPENKRTVAKYLRDIGGNDNKDFTIRICRNILSNSVAELCSLTGRKNNFSLGSLELVKLMFGAVHQKTACSKKDFEAILAEWLRHAKQRRERESKI